MRVHTILPSSFLLSTPHGMPGKWDPANGEFIPEARRFYSRFRIEVKADVRGTRPNG